MSHIRLSQLSRPRVNPGITFYPEVHCNILYIAIVPFPNTPIWFPLCVCWFPEPTVFFKLFRSDIGIISNCDVWSFYLVLCVYCGFILAISDRHIWLLYRSASLGKSVDSHSTFYTITREYFSLDYENLADSAGVLSVIHISVASPITLSYYSTLDCCVFLY